MKNLHSCMFQIVRAESMTESPALLLERMPMDTRKKGLYNPSPFGQEAWWPRPMCPCRAQPGQYSRLRAVAPGSREVSGVRLALGGNPPEAVWQLLTTCASP